MRLSILKSNYNECDINLPENTDDTHEYWEFTGSNMRMGSDGSFTFSYQWAMQSDDFKPASSSITVYATATSSSSDQAYYIALYKKNASGNDTQIKDIKYTANGKTQSYTFKELSTDSTYYLYFTKPLTSTAKITGSGRIETIQ